MYTGDCEQKQVCLPRNMFWITRITQYTEGDGACLIINIIWKKETFARGVLNCVGAGDRGIYLGGTENRQIMVIASLTFLPSNLQSLFYSIRLPQVETWQYLQACHLSVHSWSDIQCPDKLIKWLFFEKVICNLTGYKHI